MRVTIFGSGYVGLVTGACLADAGNHVIRKISSGGVVSTLVGLAGTSGFVNDATAGAPAARFNQPRGIAINAAHRATSTAIVMGARSSRDGRDLTALGCGVTTLSPAGCPIRARSCRSARTPV